MSIKNSFKIMLNRFGIVGEILLFLFIFLVVFCGLGAIYIQPVIQSAMDLHFSDRIMNFYDVLLSGSSFRDIIESAKDIGNAIKSIFISDDGGIVLKTFFVPILFFVTFNLFVNMYELPLCKVLEARMSSNARLPLINNVISLSGKSALYVLVKLLFSIIADAIILLAIWGVYRLVLLTSLSLLIPFAVLLISLLMFSLKYTFTVTWEQHIIIGEKRIFSAFFASVKDGFGHFFMTSARYFVSFVFAIVINGLMALLTFGVGLIITVPVTVMYFKLLQMTAYYKWNGKRYYIDGHRIFSPAEMELNEKLD